MTHFIWQPTYIKWATTSWTYSMKWKYSNTFCSRNSGPFYIIVNYYIKCVTTVCRRTSDPFYIVSYCIKYSLLSGHTVVLLGHTVTLTFT